MAAAATTMESLRAENAELKAALDKKYLQKELLVEFIVELGQHDEFRKWLLDPRPLPHLGWSNALAKELAERVDQAIDNLDSSKHQSKSSSVSLARTSSSKSVVSADTLAAIADMEQELFVRDADQVKDESEGEECDDCGAKIPEGKSFGTLYNCYSCTQCEQCYNQSLQYFGDAHPHYEAEDSENEEEGDEESEGIALIFMILFTDNFVRQVLMLN